MDVALDELGLNIRLSSAKGDGRAEQRATWARMGACPVLCACPPDGGVETQLCKYHFSGLVVHMYTHTHKKINSCHNPIMFQIPWDTISQITTTGTEGAMAHKHTPLFGRR